MVGFQFGEDLARCPARSLPRPDQLRGAQSAQPVEAGIAADARGPRGPVGEDDLGLATAVRQPDQGEGEVEDLPGQVGRAVDPVEADRLTP